MFDVTKHLRLIIATSLLLSLPTLFSCAKPKTNFFNDSDKVSSGLANVAVPTPTFDWVLMSKGKYRTITTVNPQ